MQVDEEMSKRITRQKAISQSIEFYSKILPELKPNSVEILGTAKLFEEWIYR